MSFLRFAQGSLLCGLSSSVVGCGEVAPDEEEQTSVLDERAGEEGEGENVEESEHQQEGCDCALGHRCVSDQCVPAPHLVLSVTNSSASGCFFAEQEVVYDVLPLAQLNVGACEITRLASGTSGTFAFAPLDPGSLRVEGPAFGTAVLAAPAGEACLSPTFDGGVAFELGDELRFTSDGSPDVPAFDATLTGVDEVDVQGGTLTSGEPWTVAVGGEVADELLLLVNAFDSESADLVSIRCTFTDAQTVVVPSEVTSHLPAIMSQANLVAIRRRREHLEPAESVAVVDVVVTSSIVRTLDVGL